MVIIYRRNLGRCWNNTVSARANAAMKIITDTFALRVSDYGGGTLSDLEASLKPRSDTSVFLTLSFYFNIDMIDYFSDFSMKHNDLH